MKYLLISIIILFGFAIEKTYTVKFNEKQLFDTQRQITEVRAYLLRTNLPLQDYFALDGRLDSVWRTIYSQLPDSIKTKK